jgi:hypothetical protein
MYNKKCQLFLGRDIWGLFFTFNFPLISREALRWKARKGGSRWGRGGKKASL